MLTDPGTRQPGRYARLRERAAGGAQGICLQLRGGRLRGARRRQAQRAGGGDGHVGPARGHSAAAPSTNPGASRRSCSSWRIRASASSSRGSGRSRSSPARSRNSWASTRSTTWPTTPSRRSSTTSAAWAHCRWWSTRTSPPGSSEWYRQEDRHAALLTGWREACVDAGAAWGGGESPSLPELVHAPEIELAGSAVGLVPDGRPAILGEELAPGRRDRARRQQRPARQRLLARAADRLPAARRLRDTSCPAAGASARRCWIGARST